MRYGHRRLLAVHGDAHQFGAGLGKRRDLLDSKSTSAVSVLVMLCTTMGAPPPTVTAPGALADEHAHLLRRGSGSAAISVSQSGGKFWSVIAAKILWAELASL